jgi:hypothetical protein
VNWGDKWNDEGDRELKRLWYSGMPRPAIAKKLSRSLDSIGKRAFRLGLRRRAQAPAPKPYNNASSQGFEPRNDAHVALVMAKGGFPTLCVMDDGKPVWLWPLRAAA